MSLSDDLLDEESNLIRHARTELTLIREEPEVIEWYLRVIRTFNELEHSGGSAPVTISVLNSLLQYKNLSALTDDPDEWYFHGEHMWGKPGGIWQNKRNSEAFSNNGGKSYYLLSEGGNDSTRRPIHHSKPANKK